MDYGLDYVRDDDVKKEVAQINTRDIAGKLFAYARLIEAEHKRYAALYEITRDDHASEMMNALEREAESVHTMANELWEMKKAV